MRPQTRARVGQNLCSFVEQLLTDHRVVPPERFGKRPKTEIPQTQPFHEAFFSKPLLLASSFERSFSTRLGNTFEMCAQLIGMERFAESRRNYRLQGAAARAALSTIDSIVSDIGRNGLSRPYRELVSNVASAYAGDEETLERPVVLDLFLRSEGAEFYFEMKSPQPNKDQCVETTRKLLRVHAVRRSNFPQVQTYYAMCYNPYGTRADYSHSYAEKYLDMSQQVLIAEEFWDLVGGSGTYEEVLSVYQEVGHKYRDLIDRVAPAL